jgi:serine/threonine protein kinase
MTEIYLARGAGVAGVERYCVLKRILRERASDAQFVHEARLAAQLQHPSIGSVYDIGMLGDSYFFTMEYVHGETVRAVLQRAQGLRRPLPLACVLTMIAGTAAGLHHAHERNGTTSSRSPGAVPRSARGVAAHRACGDRARAGTERRRPRALTGRPLAVPDAGLRVLGAREALS